MRAVEREYAKKESSGSGNWELKTTMDGPWQSVRREITISESRDYNRIVP